MTIQIQTHDGVTSGVWDRGYFQLKELQPGIVFCRKTGVFPADAFAPISQFMEKAMANNGNQLVTFCDFSEFKNYEPAYRQAWLEWFLKRRQRVTNHVFLTSAIVRMALQVINLAVRVFSFHATLAELDAMRAKLGYPAFKCDPLSPAAIGERLAQR